MKRQPIAVRVLSGFTALTMLVQPVLAAATGLTSARQLEEGLIRSGVFQNADAPETESLAAVWGEYLATFAARADGLRTVLASESRMTDAMREQLTTWAALRSELRAEGDAVKLAASVDELDRLLRTSLDRRDETIRELSGHVDSIADTAAQLAQRKTADASAFVAAYEFDMTARLLESERGLVDRTWNALVLGQAGLLEAANADETQHAAGLTPTAALAETLDAEPDVLAQWNDTRMSLAATFSKPRQQIDWEREAALLDASRRLADRASEGLRGKADANSKAHAAMVERFAAIVEQRTEQLAALATESVDGLRESAFLHVVDPESLQGEWAAHARRHQEIARGLVAGLGEADRIFEQHRQVARQALDEAHRLFGTVARAENPAYGEAFVTLREGLLRSHDELERYEKALRQLDAVRLALLAQATRGGKQPFEQANLRNPEEAVAYARLGQIYEVAHALMLEIRMELGGIQTLVAAAQGLGIETQVSGLRDATQSFDTFLPRWGKMAAVQRTDLEQLRALSKTVAGHYSRDLAAFAEALEGVAKAHDGPYGKVLAAMQARTQRGADALAGLTSPMLDALGGDAPRISAPVMSWSGAVSLQGALKRSIERGHYFRTAGAADLASLHESTTSQGTAGFASSLALVDLAKAIDYPLRVFVAPDGMAIAVGWDGPGAIIRGIGNPEQYRFDPNEPRVSVIPDFTVQGVLVGWDLWGDFQNFVDDAGQALGNTAHAIGQAAGDMAQGVQQFGAEVVDAVGPAVTALAEGAVEVGSFIVDTAVDFGQSFIDDPWKIVQYVGYGAAIVVTGGAATPFVAVAIASDISSSGVDVAERRGYIDENIADAGRLVCDVTQLVAGGLASGGAAGASVVGHAATVAQLGVGISTGSGVGIALLDYAEKMGQLDAETAAALRLAGGIGQFAGGVMTAGGLFEGFTGGGNLSDMFHNVHGLTSGILPASFTKSVIADAVFRGAEFLELIHRYIEVWNYSSALLDQSSPATQEVDTFQAPPRFEWPKYQLPAPYQWPAPLR